MLRNPTLSVFLATLSNEEAVAVIAMVMLKYLIKEARNHDALTVADTLLVHDPALAYAMVKKGTAAHHVLKTKFYNHYPTAQDVPDDQRKYSAYLQRVNQHLRPRRRFGLATSREMS